MNVGSIGDTSSLAALASTSASPAATLRRLLTAMQQDLGYAGTASGSASSTGNSVSLSA